MAKVKITQIRSAIGRKGNQKRTLEALGIKKMNGTVEHTVSPSIQGMIDTVAHLVAVEELEA